MFCTDKEKETCDVEKRGCKGCYYIREVPTPDNPIPIEKQTEYYYDTGEEMLIKGYKDMNKELDLLNKVIDIMLLDICKYAPATHYNKIRLVFGNDGVYIDPMKTMKEYYFKKAREE
jgi:retron-type reverse transcriptase